mgnify:CR=1 FL=1
MVLKAAHARVIAEILLARQDAANFGGPAYTLDDARAENTRTGWTYDVPGSQGRWVRHEGVRLTDSELRQAWALVDPLRTETDR